MFPVLRYLEVMDIRVLIVTLVCLLAPPVRALCQDLDTQACIMMEKNYPDLCLDRDLSTQTCPDYCKQCPLTCYHCEYTANASDCGTQELCDIGQKCMIRELTSSVDGNHEFSLMCANANECDGILASNAVIGRRDLSVHCCDTDLCNRPAATTTAAPTTTTSPVPTTSISTTCKKDVLVLIENLHLSSTSSIHHKYMTQDVKNLITSLVYDMHVDQHTGSLFEVAFYDHDVDRVFKLTDNPTKTQLLHAINNITTHDPHEYVDVHDLIDYVTKEAFSTYAGDRPGVPNDVIIILNHHADFDHNAEATVSHALPQLQATSGNVILVNVGFTHHTPPLDSLATDMHHVFSVSNYDTLFTVKSQIMSLLCPQP